MVYASCNVQLDAAFPVSYSPRGTESEQATLRSGKKRSHATSSVAVLPKTLPRHINNAWTTDSNHCRCHTPPKEPTDPAVRKIIDLLKTRKDGNDDESEQAIVEWQMVAMVADRVMLVVFTLLVLVVCTALFGGAPT